MSAFNLVKFGIRQKSLMLPDKNFIISAKKLGFDGVELNTIKHYFKDRLCNCDEVNRIKELSIDTKIEIHSVSVSAIRDFDFVLANHKEFAFMLRIIDHLAKVGSKIGAKYLMLPIFTVNHNTLNSKLLINRLKKILEIAKINEVTIAFESFLSLNDLLDLLNQIDSDYLKICFDVGIATKCNYELFESIIKLREKIGYFHIKDSNRLIASKNSNLDFFLLQKLRTNSDLNNSSIVNGGTKWTIPLGEGDVDFEAIKKALKIINYKGFLVLETSPGNDPLGNASSNLSLLKGFISSI